MARDSKGGRNTNEPATLVASRQKRYAGPGGSPVQVRAAVERQELRTTRYDERYSHQEALGEGAMGEVLLVRDKRIGRDVALKRLLKEHREARPDLEDRFIREARVQGQLEHPAIVPVYDIATDDDGMPFFTMKRVRGRTMAEVLEGLRSGDEAIVHHYSRRRLLTAMSRVCLCVAFAHERGVVHRDLKPANIMLGEYGEVHLLDWGIAQIRDMEDPKTADLNLGSERVTETQAGFVIGTPGYMAPEQARGERETFGGRSDVYSLGAILFEVVTLLPLHEATDVKALLYSTVNGVEARPSVRAPSIDLPRELDTICMRATALDPLDRYPGAREMNDAIESVLDGDRDSTRRAELAAEQVDVARHALEWARRGGPTAVGMHRKAVGALLQALALEPHHPEARSVLVDLLLEPGEALPDDALEELQAVKMRDRVRAARENVYGLVGLWPIIPLALWMGIREPMELRLIGFGALAVIVYLIWMERTKKVGPRYAVPLLIGAFLLIAANGFFLGPLFVVPGLAVATATSSMVALRSTRTSRVFINVLCQSAILIPALLDYFGVVSSRYVFENGQMCILPGMTNLPATQTWAFLLTTNMLTAALGTVLAGRAVEALLRAERAMFAQAWRLRQFLPEIDPGDRRPRRRR